MGHYTEFQYCMHWCTFLSIVYLVTLCIDCGTGTLPDHIGLHRYTKYLVAALPCIPLEIPCIRPVPPFAAAAQRVVLVVAAVPGQLLIAIVPRVLLEGAVPKEDKSARTRRAGDETGQGGQGESRLAACLCCRNCDGSSRTRSRSRR